MTALAIDALLAAAVRAAWLGRLGFTRLRDPLDRVHCVAFINATARVAITGAGLLAGGGLARDGPGLALRAAAASGPDASRGPAA